MVVIRQKPQPEDGDDPDRFRKYFGPSNPDLVMRQALNYSWLNVPLDNRTVPEVSKNLRQHVEDALAKMCGPGGALHACEMGDQEHGSEGLKRMAAEVESNPDWFGDPANQALMHDVMADQMINYCILGCWVLLPVHRRTEADIAVQVRRITERVLSNLEEDERIFRDLLEDPSHA